LENFSWKKFLENNLTAEIPAKISWKIIRIRAALQKISEWTIPNFFGK
jgi:hypothetical protein